MPAMKHLLPLVLLSVVVLSLSASRAEARGLPVYNTGQEVFDQGPLPDPYKDLKAPDGTTMRAGYYCDIKGVLWSYFSVSNCKPAAYVDDSIYTSEDAAEQAALEAAITKAYPDMKRPFWGRFGWMILAAIVLAGVAFAIKDKLTGKGDD
jgi:hypothetical protein